MEALADEIVVPLRGLPKGVSAFNFTIGGEFFQKFGNARIKDADCSVKVKAERQSTVMRVACEVVGFVVVECDRCLDDLSIKVDVERELTVGFGAVDLDDSSDSEDVVVATASDRELSLDQFVYDYVCLSLPIVTVHPDGKCNPEMAARLKELMKKINN